MKLIACSGSSIRYSFLTEPCITVTEQGASGEFMLTVCSSSCFSLSAWLRATVLANRTYTHAYLLISCSKVHPSKGTGTYCLLNDTPPGESFVIQMLGLHSVALHSHLFFNCQIIFWRKQLQWSQGEKLLKSRHIQLSHLLKMLIQFCSLTCHFPNLH